MKRTTILIKKNCIYLEAFRMSTKQLQLFFFAITEWYSVNRTAIISYAASKTAEDENELHPHI